MLKTGFAILLFLLAIGVSTTAAADRAGGLSESQIHHLMNGIIMDAPTRAAMNAVTNNDIRDLVLNRDVAARSDDVFSFKLPTKGITDQEKTGRCWLFAGMNILRQNAIRKWKLDEFELSQSYLAFWDKFEKANVFLEFIIESRDRDILDRELSHMLEYPVSDGGYWEYVVNLVEKHGVVPKKFMGETQSSANTGRMDYLLETQLRRDATILRGMSREGKRVNDLRTAKTAMLQDVLRVLIINYGMPPAEFVWRTASDSGGVSEPITYTPREFYRQVAATDLADYVSLAHYPIHPFGEYYSIDLTRSMADRPDITFVNVDGSQLKSLALRALLDSNRVWFGCDMGHDVHGKKGLMVKGLYDYEELFGVKLDMTKQERLDYRHSASNHAMVLVGVDMVDGKPLRWRVENSWGKDRGDGGFFVMSDDWFDEYVLNIIVPRSYLPPDLLAALERPPTKLPVWDPAWRDLRW
ncbi:C1 family peptidase [bacterium]|nr:C1 family peptidase [bacterium]MBU1984243.1 C1 family peptidase [bacterium]